MRRRFSKRLDHVIRVSSWLVSLRHICYLLVKSIEFPAIQAIHIFSISSSTLHASEYVTLQTKVHIDSRRMAWTLVRDAQRYVKLHLFLRQDLFMLFLTDVFFHNSQANKQAKTRRVIRCNELAVHALYLTKRYVQYLWLLERWK